MDKADENIGEVTPSLIVAKVNEYAQALLMIDMAEKKVINAKNLAVYYGIKKDLSTIPEDSYKYCVECNKYINKSTYAEEERDESYIKANETFVAVVSFLNTCPRDVIVKANELVDEIITTQCKEVLARSMQLDEICELKKTTDDKRFVYSVQERGLIDEYNNLVNQNTMLIQAKDEIFDQFLPTEAQTPVDEDPSKYSIISALYDAPTE